MLSVPSFEQQAVETAAHDTELRDDLGGQPAAADSRAGGRLAGKLRGPLSVVTKLAYPLVILCAWHWDTPRYIGCVLFVLLWLQRWTGTGAVAASLRRLTPVDWCVAGVLSCASAAIVLTNSELLLRLYPAGRIRRHARARPFDGRKIRAAAQPRSNSAGGALYAPCDSDLVRLLHTE
jgi:hypothetical protein